MAYVYSKPASMRIQLPRRPWNTGLGQSFSSNFCNWLGITTGWCAQYAPATPPAMPAPAAPQTLVQMTSPADWSPEISEIETQQQASQTAADFFNTLPNPAGACDSTAVVWTDPSTFCPSTWGIVGLVAVGVIGAVAYAAKRKR